MRVPFQLQKKSHPNLRGISWDSAQIPVSAGTLVYLAVKGRVHALSLSLSLDLHFDRVQATSVPSLRPMRFREEKESPEVALFQATCLWDIFDSTSVAMRLIWTNKLPCWVYLGLLESITVESSSMATLP